MHLLVVFMLVLSCAIQDGAAKLPGLEITYTQYGLTEVAKVGVEQLIEKLKSRHYKDIEGTSKMHVGKVDYSIRNIAIRSVTAPSAQITISSGLGLTWNSKGMALSLHGDWHIKYKYHFIHIKDHGSLDVSGSGIGFSLSVKMGVDKTGRPTIYTTACSSDIGSLKVRFHGGASWLYNLFDHSLASKLKRNLIKDICNDVKSAITKDVTEAFAKLVVRIPIGRKMVLDFSLTQAPVFKTGYLQSMHKAEVMWQADPKPYPVEARPLPPVRNHTRMLYFSASEYIVNSYCYAVYKHGLVHYTLSTESMPKGEGGFLNTTCHGLKEICIGNFLHPAAVKYPNSSVIAGLVTTHVPYFTFHHNGINLTLKGEISLHAKTPEHKVVDLLKIGVTFNLSINAWLDDITVKAGAIAFKPTVTVIYSKIGPIPDENIQFIFKLVNEKFITPQLKALGRTGFKIPVLKNVKYTKPELELKEGSAMFGTDFKWPPHRHNKSWKQKGKTV